MEVLRRIDKGYTLIKKARRRAEKLLDIEGIEQLEQEIKIKKEEEDFIRSKIDEVKATLLKKEQLLAEMEQEIEEIIRTLYDGEMMGEEEHERMKEREQRLYLEKEQAEKEMFASFSRIDGFTKQLYAHKHKMGALERKLSKQRINQQEKLVYLEDKIKVMEKKIRKLRRTVDVELMERYDKRKEETDVVFSKIESGACKICGQRLAEELLIKVVADEEPVDCPNCARILYIDESE